MISVTKTITETMSKPYSNCEKTSQIDTLLSREMAKLNFTYTRRNCITFCQQMLIIEKIGCADLRLPNILNATSCTTPEQFQMLENISETGLNLPSCFEYCPYECDSVYFSLGLSIAKFPSKSYYKQLIKGSRGRFFAQAFNVSSFANVTFDMLSESVFSLFIYFDEITTTEISEAPTLEWFSLIAGIGGTMGLFIGVSLLSFVEFFELLVELVLILTNSLFKSVKHFILKRTRIDSYELQ